MSHNTETTSLSCHQKNSYLLGHSVENSRGVCANWHYVNGTGIFRAIWDEGETKVPSILLSHLMKTHLTLVSRTFLWAGQSLESVLNGMRGWVKHNTLLGGSQGWHCVQRHCTLSAIVLRCVVCVTSI